MESIKFVNLTPHDVKIFVQNDAALIIKPSGAVARCAELPGVSDESRIVLFNGTPVTIRKQRFGPITGLPDAEPGVIYIVSGMVKERANRDDVVAPDTSLGAVRDANGRIEGVLGLVA